METKYPQEGNSNKLFALDPTLLSHHTLLKEHIKIVGFSCEVNFVCLSNDKWKVEITNILIAICILVYFLKKPQFRLKANIQRQKIYVRKCISGEEKKKLCFLLCTCLLMKKLSNYFKCPIKYGEPKNTRPHPKQ